MVSGIAQWQASVLAINHGLPHCSPRTTNKKLLLAGRPIPLISPTASTFQLFTSVFVCIMILPDMIIDH
ncbi:hypothetical protein ALC56_13484 [Trachymyrmex septentrionalis]|uniref:Uncharacterized protein n=1 Tax=Trachymyrmex septentrionalis TaxID=34720 RepID=A0A195EVC9_9HYME|nr:hypothetical protein ALC56_13484 [Trachymyrmex septentrionalis]